MKMINMNLDQSVSINTNELDWRDSSRVDVFIKELERTLDDGGRATSIVLHKAGTSFGHHPHPSGEEILVLDGEFYDESGEYKKGAYIRNPPEHKHKSFSNEGCTLFVKLNQFSQNDTKRVHIDTTNTDWHQGQGRLQVMPLHSFGNEHVALVKWPANERFQPHTHFGGEEIYVISGEFIDEHGRYPAGTWLRNPHLSKHYPYVEEETIILVKVGHL